MSERYRNTSERWSADIEQVASAARHIILDSFGTHRLHTDADGAVLEFRDLATGVAWRARVTDPDAGTWTQDIWALPPLAGGHDWHDPDTARLAIEVALAGDPLRRVEHRPFVQRAHPGPAGRDYVHDWAAAHPSAALQRVQAQAMFWHLSNTAAATRWTAPWEDAFGLTDAWIDDGGSGTGIAYAEAYRDGHRLTVTSVHPDNWQLVPAQLPAMHWMLMVSDAAIPLDPDLPAPTESRPGFPVRWTAQTLQTYPGATLTYPQFLEVFRVLLSRLGPLGPAFWPVPDELVVLAGR